MKSPCTNHGIEGRLASMAGRKKKASGVGGWRPGAGRKREIQDPVRITVDLEREDLAELTKRLSEALMTAAICADEINAIVEAETCR